MRLLRLIETKQKGVEPAGWWQCGDELWRNMAGNLRY
jgi:hypothetical protein